VDEHEGDKLRGELLANSETDLIDAVLGLQDAIDQSAGADDELHYLQRVALVTTFSRLAPRFTAGGSRASRPRGSASADASRRLVSLRSSRIRLETRVLVCVGVRT
jgi:hypothetical protein